MLKFLGVSAIIFTLIFYIVYFIAVPSTSRKHSGYGYFFIITALLLSSSYGIFMNPMFRVLNGIIIPGSIILSLLFLQKEHLSLKFVSILKRLILVELLSGFIASIKYPILLKGIFSSKMPSGYSKSILKGLFISLPILLVVSLLLMEADAVFKSNYQMILENLNVFEEETVFRFIASCIFTCLVFGLLYSQTNKSVDLTKLTNFRINLNIDVVVIFTLLILLNVLYTVFTYTQIIHLYFQIPSDTPGFNYANYARSGFFQLVFVVVINLVLITFLKSFVKSAKRNVNMFLNSLYSLTTAYTLNMVVSALYKMNLYIDTFGQTRLRIMVSVFTVLLGVLLLLLIIYIWTEKSMFIYGLCTTAIFYIFLNFVNIDQIIAKHNLYTADNLDFNYLMGLSEDATPAVNQAYEDNKLSDFQYKRWSQEKFIKRENPAEHWYQYNYMNTIQK
jgi:hypothetical protein